MNDSLFILNFDNFETMGKLEAESFCTFLVLSVEINIMNVWHQLFLKKNL